MKPTILTIEGFAALLSAWGLVQGRWKALRLAIVLGWAGALPGFLAVMMGGHGVAPMPVMDLIRGLSGLLLAYLVFALPLFGPFMFVTGLVGGALINRYSQPPSPRWVQPAAIVTVAVLAAVPIILLDEKLASAALGASVFWAVVLVLARPKLFDCYAKAS